MGIKEKIKQNLREIIEMAGMTEMAHTVGTREKEEINGRFQKWITSHPDQDLVEEVMLEMWNESASGEGVNLSDSTKREMLKRLNMDSSNTFTLKRKTPTLRVLSRVAAVVIPIVLIVGGCFFVIEKKGRGASEGALQAAHWIVPNGEKINGMLADCTSICCNVGSELIVNIGKDERVVSLTGETFFDVSKDASRPFVVKTNDFNVCVVGTVFNVDNYPDQTVATVTLESGDVTIVMKNGKEFKLEKGQQFVYNKEEGVGVISQTDALKWAESRKGKLICYEMTIPEILRSVERKFGYTIEIDPGIRFNKVRYNGDFLPEDSPQYIMTLIQAMDDVFNYTIKDKSIKMTIKN